MNARDFDDAHPRKRNLSNPQSSSEKDRCRERYQNPFQQNSTIFSNYSPKPKKIKLSDNLLPNLLEKMNVDVNEDVETSGINHKKLGPSGFSPNGRKSPDKILNKSEFRSVFQSQALQKIQEDENEYNNSNRSDESSSSDDDCFFADGTPEILKPNVINSNSRLKINVPINNSPILICSPTIIPFNNSGKKEDKNMQILPYQPKVRNLSAAFPPGWKMDVDENESEEPKERQVQRNNDSTPAARRRISGVTDTDFIASIDME